MLRDETSLKSISDLFVNMGKGGKALDNYLAHQAQGWMPYSAAGREISNYVDPVKRDINGDSRTQTIENGMLSVIPAYHKSLPARHDEYGQVMPAEPEETTDPAIIEMERLKSLGNAKVFTPVTANELLSSKELKDIGLTGIPADILQNYSELKNKKVLDFLRDYIKTEDWHKMSDKDKIKMVRNLRRDAGEAARQELFDVGQ